MNAADLKYIETCANERDNASVQKLSCADVRRVLAERAALLRAVQMLEDAASLVIERWERGDLADAVRSLSVDRDNARAAIEGATS